MTRHLAVIAAAVMGLSACNSPGTDPSADTSTATTATTTTTSPTASPTPTKTKTESETDRRERLAAQAVEEFWAKLDQLAANPQASLTELSSVARGQALTQWQRNLTIMRGDGVKQVGSVAVEASPGQLNKKTNLYEVTACIDVSKVNVVDKESKSVVPADRPPTTRYTYKVEREGDDLYVVEDLLQGKPC